MTAAAPLAFRVLGAPARLADPGALWLLLAVAALAALGVARLAGRRALLGRIAGPRAALVAPRAGGGRPAARLGLSLTGLALLALALSRPQCGTRTEPVRRSGVDLVVAIDVSRSMLARDVAPDRLTRARLEVGALLDRLGGDRIGLLVFAGEAFVQCPLTTDAGAARLFLRAVGPGSVPQPGTDLGNALRGAAEVLDAAGDARGRTRVVLLVTDGEDLEGGAAAAARALSDAGVRIFALAVGTPAGAPVPLLDAQGKITGYEKDRRGEPVVTHLDLAALQAIAERGGGEVYQIGSPDRGPAAFLPALDRLARSEVESRITLEYEDRYALAAFPAFLCLLAGLLLGEARRTPRAREGGA